MCHRQGTQYLVYGHPSHCGNPYAGYNIKISKQIPIDGFMTIPDYTPGRYKDISNMKHTHIYKNIYKYIYIYKYRRITAGSQQFVPASAGRSFWHQSWTRLCPPRGRSSLVFQVVVELIVEPISTFSSCGFQPAVENWIWHFKFPFSTLGQNCYELTSDIAIHAILT